jgi:hypothetical protein
LAQELKTAKAAKSSSFGLKNKHPKPASASVSSPEINKEIKI